MSKVIAVFGAGTGLGVSLARRFGREGFRVALVGRRKDRLDALVGQLAGEGIEAAAFPGDLSRPATAPALVDAVRERFGRIDVVEYGPVGGDMAFTPAKGDLIALVDLNDVVLANPVLAYLDKPVKIYGTAYAGLSLPFAVIHALSLQTN